MSNQRSEQATDYRKRFYWTPRWRSARQRFLQSHPLCRMCEQDDRIVAATVVDHIRPHRGNETLFWDEHNWQPLCNDCHTRHKARLEGGSVQELDASGWPL